MSVGQPKGVVLSCDSESGLIRNCDWRKAKFIPKSAKGASVTGPNTRMRYSRLVKKLVSPPGKVTVVPGTGTVTLPRRGFAGSTGTGVPSGLVSVRFGRLVPET